MSRNFRGWFYGWRSTLRLKLFDRKTLRELREPIEDCGPVPLAEETAVERVRRISLQMSNIEPFAERENYAGSYADGVKYWAAWVAAELEDIENN
jgi:hypothetical protein